MSYKRYVFRATPIIFFCLKHAVSSLGFKVRCRPLAGHGGCSLSSPVYLYGLLSCHCCSPVFKMLASRVSSSSSLLHRFCKLIEGHRPLEWFISTSANSKVVEKDLNEFQLSISPATLNCLHGFSAMTSSHCGPFSSPLHTTSSYLLNSS